MKKTSKILSLLVALCMAVTMLSGLTVFAADPFELVSYDADADFITLDFNQAIDLENSQFVVKHGDEYLEAGVDYTIAKADANSSVQADGVSSRYTYKMTLTDDIVLDDEYTVSFWDVKSSDGASTLEQSALVFSVAQLATDADLVDIVPYQWGNSNTWVRDEETGGMMIEAFNHGGNNMSYWSVVGARVGNDTTEEHILPNKSLPAGSANWTETDYTVKATIKVSNMLRGTVNFGIASDTQSMHSETATGAKFTGIKTYDYAAMTTTSHDADYYLMANSNYRQDSASRAVYFDRTKAPNYNPEAGFEFKVSSKDGVVRAFMDGAKLMDGEVEVLAGYPFASVYVSSETTDTTAKVQLYDFQVTQSTFEEVAVVAPEGYVPPEPDEGELPVEILDWDADLDFFTVDFAEEIASLDATLTQAGTMIPVTVSCANDENMVTTSKGVEVATAGATATNEDIEEAPRYTWKVQPVSGGIVRDIPYTVTIANVKDAEGNVVLANWSKTFKVEVIAEGLTHDTESSVQTYLNKSTTPTYSNVNGDDLVLTTEAKSSTGRMFVYRAVGEDTDSSKSSMSKTSPYTEKDYTVKVTFKDTENVKNGSYALSTAYSRNASYGVDHSYFRGVGMQVQDLSEVVPGDEQQDRGNLKVYDTTGAYSSANGNLYRQEYASQGSYFDVDLGEAGTTLKLSTKNQHARAYINGSKVSDMALQQDYAGSAQICVNMTAIDSTQGMSVTLADFVATRATHLDVTGEYFTIGEASVAEGAIAGNETVSILTTLTNNTLNDKAIFAACAFYNAAGAMTNLIISEVEAAYTGETDLEFANVETNGGTYAKIFVWDSADALKAWFPAIEVE